MFDNIPERLVCAVRAISSEERVFPLRYVIPAGLVIAEYLRRFATGPSAEKFFDFKPNADGSTTYEHAVRITMVGETLFLLRSQPGFPEFCRRFEGRDFRSTYFELAAARMFLRGGFELHARQEIGVKRKDFDFRAERPTDTINVEVTALTAPAFAANTVKNALNAKRKQLPDDLPAIIFCVYPESWFSIGPDLLTTNLIAAAKRFFSSKRVNAVAFMGEQHWDASGNGTLGALFVTHLPIENSAPRHPISSLDFFLNVSQDSPRSVVQRNNLLGEGPNLQDSEFYRWVDSLFDETKS
jgi:hypothetical protein